MWDSKTTTVNAEETKTKEYVFVFKTPDGRFCQTESKTQKKKKSSFQIELWDVFLACVVLGRFVRHLTHMYKKRM